MVKHTTELAWKTHSVDLEAFAAWVKVTAGEHYCGSSADSSLKLHFLEKPSQEILEAIEAEWAAMDDQAHAMCASYKPHEQRLAEKAAAKTAAIQALAAASGLTQEQVQALLS